MMEGVVEDGTGKAAAIPGYRVAGKTGTAQKVVGGVYSHSAHISSFVGFAPSTDPVLAAIVVLDEPVGKYYGGDVAAPTFSRIIGPALAYLRVPPTEPIASGSTPEEFLRVRAQEEAKRRSQILKASLKKSPPRTAPRPPADQDASEKDDRPFPAPWPPVVTAAKGTVPDLYGFDLRDALTTLARTGCTARTSGSGFVIEQTPVPGSLVAPGQICSLTLAPELPDRSTDAAQGM
jgi:stage V sporulation protein D (sporulation-specific penicillin-binding protein)